MKTISFSKSTRILNLSLLCLGLLFFSSCKKSTDEVTINKKDDSSLPPAAIESVNASSESISESQANKAAQATEINNNSESSNREDGETTTIHFGDRTACKWNPNICENTFVPWPGYIQSTGYNEWGYAWMSKGPGTNFIPHGTGDHYHIVGLKFPTTEPNPAHSSMFPTDWFAFYMQRSGVGRINFDLTQIKVNGSPITLWYKAADGRWWYWASLSPGRWNLPGATNIQEFHIKSASGTTQYGIDDIVVKGR